MKLTKKQWAKFDKKKWLKWVRSKKENHFFFFCTLHINIVKTKHDGVGDYTSPPKPPFCDYPGCILLCTYELFPNLVDTCKSAERDAKEGKLISFDEVIKNRGKKTKNKKKK